MTAVISAGEKMVLALAVVFAPTVMTICFAEAATTAESWIYAGCTVRARFLHGSPHYSRQLQGRRNAF